MATVAQTQSLPPRRLAASDIVAAIDLGWRVALLHALRPSTFASPSAAGDDLLLNRGSLGAADRLELELRAIASVAERAGVTLSEEELQALLELIPAAAESQTAENRFRGELARTHIAFAKRLWAHEESRGRAYELGNYLSDTWNRVLRPSTTPNSHTELTALFSSDRVQRIKTLLDNLQARLDPTAVHVVANHLDAWRDRVAERSDDDDDGAAAALTPDEVAKKYEPVERQTIIWRQILTGDKEPEAYIDHAKRAEVRDELSRQLRRRYWHLWWVALIVAALGAGVGLLLWQDSTAAAPIIGTLTALGGVVGVTRASMIATVKRGLQTWGELMWNRSLATVICRETLVVDELLPAPAQHRLRPRRTSARRATQ
jgi:hypothetical protein